MTAPRDTPAPGAPLATDGAVIITVAPTGGFLTREHTPHVPLQPEEIAEDVARCADEGAAVAALHARRPDGSPTCDPAIYADINARIRARCDIVLNNSTGGGASGELVVPGAHGRWEIDRGLREQAIHAGADICSLNAMTVLGNVEGRDILMSTSPAQSLDLAQRMAEARIRPEWEVFGPSHLAQDVHRAVEAGVAGTPPLVNLCFGLHEIFQGAIPYSPRSLQYTVDLLPPAAVFTVSCSGPEQVRAITHSILLGGHVRTGIEDGRYGVHGELLTNVEFVRRAVRIVRELGYRPATPDEARQILGIPSRTAVTR